jgi:hypothetical protein
MRWLIILFLFLFASNILNAQVVGPDEKKKKLETVKEYDPDWVYQPNKIFVQLGVGFPNRAKTRWTEFESRGAFNSGSSAGLLSLRAEYTTKYDVGIVAGASNVQGNVSWRVSKLDSLTQKPKIYNQGFKYNNLAMFAGASYHLQFNSILDVYSQATIGVNSFTFSPYADNGISLEQPKKPSLLYYQLCLGVRAYISKRLGAFVEGGPGANQFINAGLVFRFL